MHGENEYQLAKAAVLRRGAIPDVLQDAPELEIGLDLFWDAFGTLSTTRQLGQGFVGPIPWDKAQDYCDRMGIEDIDQRDRVIAYLRRMDSVFQTHISNKVKSKWQSPSPAP